MNRRVMILLIVVVLSTSFLFGQTGSPSPVLKAMKEELVRSFQALKTQETPPYFLSYTITDQQRTTIVASFGELESSSENHSRQLALDLRVGDYTLDNTHELRGESGVSGYRYSNIAVPIEDDPDAIRTILWLETDKRYKKAVEEYTKVKTNKAVKVKEEDTSADFSHEHAEVYTEQPKTLKIDRPLWESKLKKYTEPFKSHSDIYEAQASLEALVETKYFVSTEGTELQTSIPYVRLFIRGFSKADDGMELPRYESFFAFSPEGIPNDEVILKKVESMIADLERLRTAPIVEPYTGPAILRGGAAGVFFHEVFGHRIEGHRQKSESEGQTFKKMVGEKILPASMNVIYDPTVDQANGSDLSGYYKYDDQGVKAQRVAVVEKGVFKRFLMARSPIENFPVSNGHGRCQAGFQPVARQSNLFVETEDPIRFARLRQMLIDDCKKQNKPYGLLFSQIEGGFTITGRVIPNAFNVLPLVVYRVYTDGRPDELVRGVDLVGTPLTTFSKVTAAADDPETWYGFCGAESGGVPVSQTCPSILISQIEVQKKQKSQEKPPILPAPLEKKQS
jgi:TldD protein